MRLIKRLMRIGSILAASTFAAAVAAQAPNPTPSPKQRECSEPIDKSRDLSKQAKISAKPEPNFATRDRHRYMGETITLRAILCASGKVTDIVVTRGLTQDLDEKAIEAARQIQFTPAEKDGHKVSRSVILKYTVKD